MREPPLSDHELRVLRGLIDEHERDRFVHQWFTHNWRVVASVAAVVSAVAVFTAAIAELVRLLLGR